MGCFYSNLNLKSTEIKAKSLDDCTYRNTKKFTFDGQIFQAKCVKVYDGDTITAVFCFNSEIYRFSIRLYGLDAPELKSKDLVEKEYAVKSRDILAKLILDKNIILHCKDFDKYGRILATINIDNMDVNEYMLQEGYCKMYNGGTKEDWDFS